MQTLELIQLAKAIAPPCAFICAILVFKPELKNLMKRLKSVKIGQIKIDFSEVKKFDKDAQLAREKAEAIHFLGQHIITFNYDSLLEYAICRKTVSH